MNEPMMRSVWWRPALFAAVGAAVVLWGLLTPGFVLLLDWVPGPASVFLYESLSDYLHAPTAAILFALGMLIPAWTVQKAILVALLFSLFFLPLRFYPWDRGRGGAYFASLVAVFNPFVYERLLAGQWRVLAGYACLFPLVFFLFRFSRDRSRGAAAGVFATLVVTGMWSVHFLAIGTILVAVHALMLGGSLVRARRYDALADAARPFFGAALVALVVSMYWVVPLVMRGGSGVDAFTGEHFVAFATAEDPSVGVVGNVLTLRGFWAEGHAWAGQFVMPGSAPWVFYPAFLVLFGFVFLGWRSLRRDESDRFDRSYLSIVLVFSVVFAAGVSAMVVWSINDWLLENVAFWSGFRDTQKWTAVTALAYALLAGAGLHTLLGNIRHPRVRRGAFLAFLCLPLALAPHLPFGLSGQVSPVRYPLSWAEADRVMGDASDCRAVFLPWHQYYAVSWNDGQLVANPGSNAFRCETITGRNTELGDIGFIADDADGYRDIADALESNDPSALAMEKVFGSFREAGVRYVVVAHDLAGTDLYRYPFLGSPSLRSVYHEDGMDVFMIVAD